MSIREVKSKKAKKELHIKFISIIKINVEDLGIIQHFFTCQINFSTNSLLRLYKMILKIMVNSY